jgi:hypothetical protein
MNITSFSPIYWLVFALVLTLALNFYYPVIERKLDTLSYRWFRSSIILRYFFFPGTAIHELSHALACLLFGIRVYRVVLFHPTPDQNGNYRLGYVEHSGADPFRSTIVGIAPLIGCAQVTYLTYLWATGTHISFQPITVKSFYDSLNYLHIANWKTYVFFYIALACALSGDPSDVDLKSLPALTITVILLGVLIYFTRAALIWMKIADFFLTIGKYLAPVFTGFTLVMLF